MAVPGSALLLSRRGALLPCVLVALLASSCSGDGPTGPGAPVIATIAVTPGADTLVTVGRTRQYTAVPREADGTPVPGVTLVWSSSDPAVATVNSTTGLVTAVGPGLAEIRATAGLIVGEGTMAVVQFVAGVTITPGTWAVAAIGETKALTAVAKDSSNATVPGVRFLWISSDPDVATIDTLGVATATGPGEATISATGRGTPGYAEFTVTQAAPQLAFSIQPNFSVAGQAISPAIQVEVRDAGGTLVADSRAAVTLSVEFGGPGGGGLEGTTTVNAVGGIATFSGIAMTDANEGVELRADADGLEGDVSDPFTVSPGPVASLDMQLASVPTFEANVPYAAGIYVTALDAFGNTLPAQETILELVTGDFFDPSAHLSYPDPQDIGNGTLHFQNIVLDRISVGHRIRARVGAVTAMTVALTVRATFSQVTTGEQHACGIAPGGTFCWGNNAEYALGRLNPVDALAGDSIPGLIASAPPFTQISAAWYGACGLTEGGAAYCWGNGISSATLVPGTGAGAMVFTSITKGEGHTCGRTATGAVYCWGAGGFGQLGDGNSTPFSAAPVLVTGSGSGSRIFTSVSAGTYHTCGVTTLATAYCWGFGTNGALGDSATVDRPAPVQVAGSGTGARAFTSIDAGSGHTCAINADGAVLCWGNNGFVQLGFQGGGNVVVPTLVPFGFAVSATQVTAGSLHTCAITSFELRCWGYNAFGQLGLGSVGLNATATGNPVDLPSTPNGASAGGGLTCTTTTSGGVYCWGRNLDGELGVGTLAVTHSVFPIRIKQ